MYMRKFLKIIENNAIRIEPFKQEYKDEVWQIMVEIFGHLLSDSELHHELSSVDPSISLVLVAGDQIIGAYLLNDWQNVYDYTNTDDYEVYEDLSKYKDLRGLKGEALAVKNEYQSLGYGKKLIAYSQNMGYDYMWGEQMKGLNNLADWTKRRRLVAESNGSYITLQDF